MQAQQAQTRNWKGLWAMAQTNNLKLTGLFAQSHRQVGGHAVEGLSSCLAGSDQSHKRAMWQEECEDMGEYDVLDERGLPYSGQRIVFTIGFNVCDKETVRSRNAWRSFITLWKVSTWMSVEKLEYMEKFHHLVLARIGRPGYKTGNFPTYNACS